MPKKSRRLPGGRVRKPIARPIRPAATGAPPATDDEASPSTAPELELVESAASRPTFAPVRLRPAQVAQTATLTAVTAAAVTTGRSVAAPGRSPAAPSRTRSGAPSPSARGPAVSAGPSSMDAVAATYTHLRADLARIAILASIMLGIIVALSFILR